MRKPVSKKFLVKSSNIIMENYMIAGNLVHSINKTPDYVKLFRQINLFKDYSF